jgi:hypothetical protein
MVSFVTVCYGMFTFVAKRICNNAGFARVEGLDDFFETLT